MRSSTSSESGSKKRDRACSCPPRAARSLVSGPWSLEWLSDQHLSEVGVVSSAQRSGKKTVRSFNQVGQFDIRKQKRKKVNGVLRHPVLNLKKVARLPNRDRATVLQILKKKS